MLDWAVRDRPLDDTPLRLPDTWLLFPPALDHYGNPVPDGPPEFELGSGPPPVVRQLVLLDGSWNQARRMSHRIPGAALLPRLTLPGPAAAARRVRKAPGKPFRATLEALAEALEFLEGPEVAQPLHDLFELFVERALRQGNKFRTQP
jgi:DTW domain-containing protein YfiP